MTVDSSSETVRHNGRPERFRLNSGRTQSLIGAVPLAAAAVIAEVAVMAATFSYESDQTPPDTRFQFFGVGGWPLLAVIIEGFKLPLALFAATALLWRTRLVANICVLIVCILTFTTIKEIGSQFVQEQMQPGRLALEAAGELRVQVISLTQQLNDSDAFGENRQYLEQDLARVSSRIAEKRDQLASTVATYRADREQLRRSYLSPDVLARMVELDERLAAMSAQHQQQQERLERDLADAKVAAQGEIDAWKQQMEALRAGEGAARESADRRFEVLMVTYREALERYEKSRLRYEREVQELIARERDELARIEQEYEFQEADRRRSAEGRYAQLRQERKEAFERLPVPKEPRRELAASMEVPPSPPPIHQNPYVLEREASLASRLAEQQLERAAIISRRDELQDIARAENKGKVAEIEERERQSMAAEEEERGQIGEELRSLEAEESALRERLRSASLDPAARAARRQTLLDEIASLERQAAQSEMSGTRLIAESGPGRLAKFVPFFDRDLPVLQRTERTQEVALPILALLFAASPAFLLELSVSGVRRAFFGATESTGPGLRGFWILRRRLRRQLKQAAKERRRFATEHAEALRQIEGERVQVAQETERRAAERYAELVAGFDGLKTLEEFRDESARVIREHREDIRTLAEKLIELDASKSPPRPSPPR